MNMAKNLSDVWRYLAAMDLDREALDEFEAFFEAADGVPGPADGQIDAEEWQELQQSPDFNEFLSKFGDVPGLSPSALSRFLAGETAGASDPEFLEQILDKLESDGRLDPLSVEGVFGNFRGVFEGQYLPQFEILMGRLEELGLAEQVVEVGFTEADLEAFQIQFSLGSLYMNAAANDLRGGNDADNLQGVRDRLLDAERELNRLSPEKYRDFQSVHYSALGDFIYRSGVDALVPLSSLAYADKIAIEVARGSGFSLFHHMASAFLYRDLFICERELAKAALFQGVTAYRETGDGAAFGKALREAKARFDAAGQYLERSIGALTVSADGESVYIGDLSPELLSEFDSLRGDFERLWRGFDARNVDWQAPQNIADELLTQRLRALLSDKEFALLKHYGLDLSSRKNSAGSPAAVLSEMESEREAIERARQALKGKQGELEREIRETNQQIAATLEESAAHEAGGTPSKKAGKRPIIFPGQLQEHFAEQDERQAAAPGVFGGIASGATGGLGIAKTGSHVQGEAQLSSTGFVDRITLSKPSFDIDPNLGESYYPEAAIVSFNRANGFGTVSARAPAVYRPSETVKPTHRYEGVVTSSPHRLTLPQGYTVIPESIRFARAGVSCRFLREDYGYLSLEFGPGVEPPLAFSVGIRPETEAEQSPSLSPETHSELYVKLYDGPYAERTRRELLEPAAQVLKDGTAAVGDIVNRVVAYIEDTMVYALDERHNARLRGVPFIIGAIEHGWIDYEGKKVRPAICNVSAILAVAYLRELGIPAFKIAGKLRIGSRYSGHDWVGYYDEKKHRLGHFDPTPSRKMGNLRYENETGRPLEDEGVQSDYEAGYLKRQASAAKRARLQSVLTDLQKEKLALAVLNAKLEGAESVYKSPSFLGYVLERKLVPHRDRWNAEWDRRLALYRKNPNGEKAAWLAFVENSKKSLQEALVYVRGPLAGKPVLAHHYLRHHLAMLERLLQADPPTGASSVFWRELVADYARVAQGLSGEAVSEVIHTFRDGRTLVKVGDALYFQDPAGSFAMEPVADLRGMGARVFQETSDGAHWVLFGHVGDDKWGYVKDGRRSADYVGLWREVQLTPKGDFYFVTVEEDVNGVSQFQKAYRDGEVQPFASTTDAIDFKTDDRHPDVWAAVGQSNSISYSLFRNGKAAGEGDVLGVYAKQWLVAKTGAEAGIYWGEKRIYAFDPKGPKYNSFTVRISSPGAIVVAEETADTPAEATGISPPREVIWIHPDGKAESLYKGNGSVERSLMNFINNGGYVLEEAGSSYLMLSTGRKLGPYLRMEEPVFSDDFSRFSFFAWKPDDSGAVWVVNGQVVKEWEGSSVRFDRLQADSEFSAVRLYLSESGDTPAGAFLWNSRTNSAETCRDGCFTSYTAKSNNQKLYTVERGLSRGGHYIVNGHILREKDGKSPWQEWEYQQDYWTESEVKYIRDNGPYSALVYRRDRIYLFDARGRLVEKMSSLCGPLEIEGRWLIAESIPGNRHRVVEIDRSGRRSSWLVPAGQFGNFEKSGEDRHALLTVALPSGERGVWIDGRLRWQLKQGINIEVSSDHIAWEGDGPATDSLGYVDGVEVHQFGMPASLENSSGSNGASHVAFSPLSSLNSPANFNRLAGLCLDAPAEFSRWLKGLESKKPADLSREEIQKVLAHFFYYGREWLALDKDQLAFCEALARGNVEVLLSSGVPNKAKLNGAFWLLQEAVRLNDDRAIDAVLSRAKKIPERETLRDQVQIAWRSAHETADRAKREKWQRVLGALSPVGGNKSW